MNRALALSLVGLLAISAVVLAPSASAKCSGDEATVKACVNDYSTGVWCPADVWVAGHPSSDTPCFS
jgi:hypothetical protein